jgi:hypothetical protein
MAINRAAIITAHASHRRLQAHPGAFRAAAKR